VRVVFEQCQHGINNASAISLGLDHWPWPYASPLGVGTGLRRTGFVRTGLNRTGFVRTGLAWRPGTKKPHRAEPDGA
jgi:hypothetical protein